MTDIRPITTFFEANDNLKYLLKGGQLIGDPQDIRWLLYAMANTEDETIEGISLTIKSTGIVEWSNDKGNSGMKNPAFLITGARAE